MLFQACPARERGRRSGRADVKRRVGQHEAVHAGTTHVDERRRTRPATLDLKHQIGPAGDRACSLALCREDLESCVESRRRQVPLYPRLRTLDLVKCGHRSSRT